MVSVMCSSRHWVLSNVGSKKIHMFCHLKCPIKEKIKGNEETEELYKTVNYTRHFRL